VALPLAALAAGGLLAVAADGFVRRHAEKRVFASELSAWFADRPDDGRPVASAPVTIAPLTGDRMRRRLRPIGPSASCAEVRAHERAGYVVLYRGGATVGAARSGIGRCIARPPAYTDEIFAAWTPLP
jgi:hypothetical protein